MHKELENAVIKKLKKFEKDRDNVIGIIYTLRHAKDYEKALLRFSMYLDNPETSKTRNDLILKAEDIADLHFDIDTE